MGDPKSICVIRLSAIGDAIHTLPLVNGLRRGFPFTRLTWVVQPVPHQLVRHQSAVDEFIVFDPRGGISAWRQLHTTLAEREFDLVLVPQISAKAWMVAQLIRPARRLGFDFRRSRDFHWLMTNDHLPPHERQHVQDEQLEFFDALGIARDPVVWDLVITDEERNLARQFYSKFERPAVALVVATSREEKDWTPEGYARVIEALDRDFGMQPVLLGGPSLKERSIVETILSESKVTPAVALDGPLRETMWKVWGADLIISPDTGPLHAAVALDKPVIGLYGYSDPRRCGPYLRFGDLLIDKFNEYGGGPITRRNRPGGMLAITPADVLDKVAIADERYLDRSFVRRTAVED
jgi:heptosyltransferase I